MKTINERVQKIIDDLAKGRQKDFAERVGIPPATVNGIVGSRKAEPGYAILSKIIEKYPKVNSEWLLTGKGEPYKNGDDVTTAPKAIIEATPVSVESEKTLIEFLKSEKEYLKAELKRYAERELFFMQQLNGKKLMGNYFFPATLGRPFMAPRV